jgi:hypothetical protein
MNNAKSLVDTLLSKDPYKRRGSNTQKILKHGREYQDLSAEVDALDIFDLVPFAHGMTAVRRLYRTSQLTWDYAFCKEHPKGYNEFLLRQAVRGSIGLVPVAGPPVIIANDMIHRRYSGSNWGSRMF